ncbi:bifunctional folylpolyglutamate synthase/dihydrofolate synthase [Lentilactobacillus sp. SPB1-3]|uniref:Folylpolyglutamate synthase/dihydrofolate synthase family protein n=1 Tax=Lentilactobacillus terminaliae TaxID=3003483 RepID=A0ACD5DD25_9LACO|nr:cyanophycin synthetase [Lentilactobacillus sp. SPB1-3]MCZ0977980.1 Mur ligase family protein [Lentilactobacillus sp. SPB1-3]
MAKLTYEKLIEQLNQQMLAANTDRVALLRRVLDNLGHPEQHYRVMHLAGTNGKGSTGTMLAQTLINAGYQIGHFASPALNDAKEQIVINNKMINGDEFVDTYKRIVSQLPSDITPNDISVFEWFVLIMLQYFADQQVDWAIIEAGLGGLNDATNAISAPLITIFTHIDYDHMNILGKTIAEIATNKAQIIKSDTTVFVAPNQHDEAIKRIDDTYQKHHGSELILTSKLAANQETLFNGTRVDIKLGETVVRDVYFNLIGDAQLDNLATVVAVYNWLLKHEMVVGNDSLIKMMRDIQIPGRFQILERQPLVILDGAHNVDGASRLTETLINLRPNGKFIFILGFLKDKEYQKMARIYDQMATEIIAVSPDNHQRALTTNEIEKLFTKPTQQAVNAQVALRQARQLADEKTIIVVTGSFYLVKELENGWHENSK